MTRTCATGRWGEDESPTQVSRRQFIGAVGGGSTVLITGCVGDEDDPDQDTDRGDEPESENENEEPAQTETEPEPDIEIVETDLEAGEIETGESFSVTATLRNNGEADGSITLTLTANRAEVANENFDVSANGEKEVSLTGRLEEADSYEIELNGSSIGELIVIEVPQYDTSDEEAMVLGVDAFPDGWQRVDMDSDESIDIAFTNEDETILVWMGAEVHETVSDARERYEGAKERVDANDYSLADQASWGELPESGFVIFRHSNAFGQCWASKQSGIENVPDTLRAQEYAEEMFEHWQTIT